jgi:hypothetical protein
MKTWCGGIAPRINLSTIYTAVGSQIHYPAAVSLRKITGG